MVDVRRGAPGRRPLQFIRDSSRPSRTAWPAASGPPPRRERPGPRTGPHRPPGRWASPPRPSGPGCGRCWRRSSPPPPRRSPSRPRPPACPGR